jgi:hypothetical protein
MDVDEATALEQSIQTWEKRAKGHHIDEGRTNCALCVLASDRNDGDDTCSGCIISRHTKKVMCLGTPYADSRYDDTRTQREVDFLKGLRKYNPLQLGDIVNNIDGSYHLRLTPSTMTNSGNISWDSHSVKYRYVIVGQGLVLPSSGSRFGNNANDTIIRDVHSNEYIFTMDRFLKIAEEPKEICNECGTEL